MDDELKKKLLQRKFSSVEYMQELRDHFAARLDAMKEAIASFRTHPPEDVDWRGWHVSDRPEGWEDRAVPNFERLLWSIEQGIEDYQASDPNRIKGTTNSIMGLSKQMDVLGYKWWEYVDKAIVERHGNHANVANKHASNIYYTLTDYWGENDEDILKENITGPIDEDDLRRYLKEGEEA